MVLREFQDKDIDLIKKWLYKEYIKKWFDPIDEWLEEIKLRKSKYSFIKHFIAVSDDKEPIGFCQYYSCNDSNEDIYKDISKNTYSIDYLIGEEKYLNKGLGKTMISLLIEKVKTVGAYCIAVQPDTDNFPSRNSLLANGFEFDENKKVYVLKVSQKENL